jgi:hypothetical protein
MKPRGILLAIGALAVALVGLIWFAGTRTPACTLIMQVSMAPIELDFQGSPKSVKACFGEGCTPETVLRSDDGKWRVPQAKPYQQPEKATPVAGDGIRRIVVQASYPEGHTTMQLLPIETKRADSSWLGAPCPGPVEFLPVQVP